MAGEWREVALEDVASEITVGHVGSMASEYVPSGIPFLRSQNVEYLRINTDDIKFITPEFHKRLRKSSLSPGDVVIVRTGKPGTCAVIPDQLPVANCSDLVIVRCSQELDARFLAYFVNSAASHHVAAHLVGAVQQHFNVGSARTMRMRLPEIAEQRAITHILGALDDKIELNRRMNETLEAIARAIFKSWFVDFDPVRAKASGEAPESICRRLGLTPDLLALFPDRLADSELGEIPEGWEVKPFSETVQIIGGGTPKTSVAEYWGGEIPWFSVVDAPAESDVFVIDTEKKITQAGLGNSSARMLSVGTTIISARGTVGKVALVGVPLAMNQSCYGLRGHDGGAFFTYYATRELVSTLKQHSHGAVFDTITRDTFSGVSVVTFQPVATAFETAVAPLMEKIKANSIQGRTLAELRDALLPRLLSGAIRLREVMAEGEVYV